MLHTPPIVNARLKTIPSIPRPQFKYQPKLYFGGFLIQTHIKQGYANVTGSVRPPKRPARLERNGSATPMKKEMKP
eukprot:Gb_35850 [translate_table: standard]